jgi:hypothetical protein
MKFSLLNKFEDNEVVYGVVFSSFMSRTSVGDVVQFLTGADQHTFDKNWGHFTNNEMMRPEILKQLLKRQMMKEFEMLYAIHTEFKLIIEESFKYDLFFTLLSADIEKYNLYQLLKVIKPSKMWFNTFMALEMIEGVLYILPTCEEETKKQIPSWSVYLNASAEFREDVRKLLNAEELPPVNQLCDFLDDKLILLYALVFNDGKELSILFPIRDQTFKFNGEIFFILPGNKSVIVVHKENEYLIDFSDAIILITQSGSGGDIRIQLTRIYHLKPQYR